MSKIEKALRRAATERHLTVVPDGGTGQRVSAERSLVAAPAASPASGVEARARASAAIALMREKAPRSPTDLAERRIIHPEMRENPTVKAFREIRTQVLRASQGRNCALMVTSVVGGGGGTFVALNLASAFAFDEGKTAILFDCNLGNPQLHRLLEGPSAPGLTDYLDNPEMDLAEIIHDVGIRRLRVVPSGGRREVPGEYFTSAHMSALLESVRARYPERFLIIDAPPMTESADTQILAELCDFVILVVPYGEVTTAQIDDCVRALDRKKLLGVVFNDEPQSPAIRRGRRLA